MTAYETSIEELKIGQISLPYVSAVINPRDKSDTILLGMSALKKLECSFVDGKLLLRKR